MVKTLMDKIAQGSQIAYVAFTIVGPLMAVYLSLVSKIDDARESLLAIRGGQAVFEQRLTTIESRRAQISNDHDALLKMQGDLASIANNISYLRELVQKRGSLVNPDQSSQLAQDKMPAAGP